MTKHQAFMIVNQLLDKYGGFYTEELLHRVIENHILSKSKNVLIYGAGRIGRLLRRLISYQGGNCLAYIDRNASPGQSVSGIPVLSIKGTTITPPPENYTDASIVIAVLLKSDEMKTVVSTLKENYNNDIISTYDLLGLFCPAAQHRFHEFDKDCVHTLPVQAIGDALDLMEDDESRKVYVSCFRSYITGSYDDARKSIGRTQYVDIDIPFSKGYKNFVDCGAYNGDTLSDLIKKQNCENYIGFEPDTKNYHALAAAAEQSNLKSLLYPSAVSDSVGYAAFNETGNDSSALSIKGSGIVQTVTLDSCLHNMDISMIKMDIEGAEMAALAGARNIIQKKTPDLAVCVYHKMEDLWEIPQYIHQLVPQYKLYLRCHSDANMETVLYATV